MNILNFIGKVIKFLKKKYLDFPTLSFLTYSKNKFIKELYVSFGFLFQKRIFFKNIFSI